jgi:DNA helicase-2/ATP-dependent DNA helicase PcrA
MPSGYGNIIELLKSKPELTKKNTQIIACAGSGKTEFVSARIAYIVAEGLAKPENIVAFTFTERAAQELKFRIRSKIRELIGQQPDVGDLYVGTIHSFCYELLKEFIPGYRAFDVLDEGKRYSFINTISSDIGYKDLKDWLDSEDKRKTYGITQQAWVLNTFIRGADISREEMIAPEEISLSQAFIDAVHIYDKKLHERRFLDFSSMMSLAVQRLENDRLFLQEVRDRFTYITVDEYQDVNSIQEKLIRLMAGPANNLCVVGDDDQSIYQWRGSSVDNILTFDKRYKNVFIHHLPVNHRSTDGIINLGNAFIKRNRYRLPKKMNSSGRLSDKGDIYKISFYEQTDEADFIVNRIRNLVGTEWADKHNRKRGLAYSDIAVFFRSVRYDGRPYLDALGQAGIPYAVSGIGGLFESEEVDILFSIFSYIGDFEKLWNISSRTGSVPDINSIYDSAIRIFKLPSRKKFRLHMDKIKEHLKSKKRIFLQEVYAEILMVLGLTEEELHNDTNELMMYNLGHLSRAISDYEGTRTYCTFKDIERFCWFIKHYAEGSYDAGAGEDPTRIINAVQIMTLHGAKGLGFPVVFMPYCVERKQHLPDSGFLNPDSFQFTRYSGSVEDERRLFYVGMTRAKKFLYITTSQNRTNGKKKKTPSRFFNELDARYCIIEPVPDPSKRKRLPPEPSVEEYRFPTSYSELSDYIRCEYDYKMRYVYGFNPVIVQALGYGNQIHNLLNILHKMAQKTGKVPLEEEAAELLKEHFYLKYAAKDQEEILKRSALRSILRYMGMWKEDFSLSVKTERSFEMDVDNALLTGTIDLLKRENADNNILEIIDFKTGNERKHQEALHLQVQLYTVAARNALNLDVQKAYVHFLDEHKQPRVEILTTPKQLDLAMLTISDAVKGITTRRFNRNPRNMNVCNTCDWEKLCPKKKK